jgi:hypothetical protein
VPNLVRMDVPGYARPLPILLWGQAVERSCVVRLSLLKGSWPASALALGLILLDQLGLDRSGLY